MSWTSEPALFRYVTQALDFHLRTERLRLAKQVQQVEERLRSEGVDPTPLIQFRQALRQLPTLELDPLHQLPSRPKPKFDDPLTYLKVATSGSVF